MQYKDGTYVLKINRDNAAGFQQDTLTSYKQYATPAVSGLVALLKQCSNKVGPPANNNIHHVAILRTIFNKHMITKSDSGLVDVFDPVKFFLRVIDEPNILNEIVKQHLNQVEDMEHQLTIVQ